MSTGGEPRLGGHADRLVLTANGQGRVQNVLVATALGFTIAASAAGLFLGEPPIRLGPDLSSGDFLRLFYVLVLVAGLGHASFRYAQKHHGLLDELALLLFLTCGVNLIVQLTGGGRSYWQGLYLLLGGLASVAFSRRVVLAMVAVVLSVEVTNWALFPETSIWDYVRLALLFLVAVGGYGFMERAERERAERAEDRLLRLDAGLKQLGGYEEDEAVSPLSEDGLRAGRAEQLHRLESHIQPLLSLVKTATGASEAVLLQVADNASSYWVRLTTRTADESEGPEGRRWPLRGSIFSELVRSERDVVLSSSNDASRLPWLPKGSAAASILAIPIRIWNEPPWVLVVHHGDASHFDGERRAMARSVAQQMKEAQALFRQKAQQHVEELELKGLLRASEKLSGTTRLGELLEHMLEYARDVSRFDTCAICLREERREQVNVVVAEGYRRELLGSRFTIEAPTWAGWVLRAREEPLAIRMERRSGMPILDPRERIAPGSSFLAVPLRAQKRVSGALLLTRQGESFTARELRLLRIYCNQAAVAIENAIVYEKVESLAATDALTGLFNRRYFDGALARELARCDRTSSRLALLVLDIDHFKSFNDTYGHVMGDMVLKKVAGVLSRALRKADIFARFGGEEFVVILPQQVTATGALESAERLRAAVAGSGIHPGGPRKKVTVSVGVALFPDDAEDGHGLLEAADEALYEAKELGRNRVAVYRRGVAPSDAADVSP